MTRRDRYVSRRHGSVAARTNSVPSEPSRTVVARAKAAPTTAVQAKRTLASDRGCRRSTLPSARTAKCRAGVTMPSVSFAAVRLILASRSPRRARLLREAGYEFEVMPADVDESRLDGEPPRRYVSRLAARKASAVAPRAGERIVVAADTVVLIDGLVLGKPADRRAAVSMLGRLSGRTHEVLTGVVVARGGRLLDAVEVTRVTFATLDGARIAWYAGTGEPDDKAGAYAVQGIGSRFIERIEGSYTNVVGLPVAVVDDFVRQLRTASDACG